MTPCLHLLIPENPCSTGASLDTGFSLDSTSLLPILGFVQFQWLRVRSPSWGGTGLSCWDIHFWEVLCAKGSWQGFFLGHCHTLWVLTPFLGCPQCSVVAKWPHLQLQLPTFPSTSPGNTLKLLSWHYVEFLLAQGYLGMGCASLSGMLSPVSPFPLALPLWKSPSCLSPVSHLLLGQLRAGYLWIHFLLDPHCLLGAEAFGVFGRSSPSREL